MFVTVPVHVSTLNASRCVCRPTRGCVQGRHMRSGFVHVSTLNASQCGPTYIYAALTNITQLWRKKKKSFRASALSPSSQVTFQYTFAPTVFLSTGPEKLGHAQVLTSLLRLWWWIFASTLETCAVAGKSGAVPVVTREFTKLYTVVALKITRTSPTSPSVQRTAHADGYLNNE